MAMVLDLVCRSCNICDNAKLLIICALVRVGHNNYFMLIKWSVITHFCCYRIRVNLTEWWTNTLDIRRSLYHNSLKKIQFQVVMTDRISFSFWLLSQFIFAIVIPGVGWSKVMFLLLLIFRLNWEIPQLGKRLSSIDSPALRIQFWSICSRRWNSFHLETPTKYQKHTFVRKFEYFHLDYFAMCVFFQSNKKIAETNMTIISVLGPNSPLSKWKCHMILDLDCRLKEFVFWSWLFGQIIVFDFHSWMS